MTVSSIKYREFDHLQHRPFFSSEVQIPPVFLESPLETTSQSGSSSIIMFMNIDLNREKMMTKKFAQQKQELSSSGEEDPEKKRKQLRRVMEIPELSLGPSQFVPEECTKNSIMITETNANRKRKFCWDNLKSEVTVQTSVELQAGDPLPLDWEQCLDLESGKVYYLNRKTLKKSCSWPKDQNLDLELNMSTFSTTDGKGAIMTERTDKPTNSNGSMVAVACQKCHLLVMLSRSSPSCPNCKYFHAFPMSQSSSPKITSIKSLETLSLLN